MRFFGRTVRGKLEIAGAAFIAGLAAVAALYYSGSAYLMSDLDRPAAETAAKPAATDPFKFSFFDQPRPVPELHFVDGEEHAMSLADFRGRAILLNIWATWCVPCRKEMPTLDRLQAELGGPDFQVVTLSIDHGGVPVVKQFYKELGLKALGIYVDQSGQAATALRTVGVPTTLLIDREGREVGRKLGPAEWDSPQVIAVIRERLRLPPRADRTDGSSGDR